MRGAAGVVRAGSNREAIVLRQRNGCCLYVERVLLYFSPFGQKVHESVVHTHPTRARSHPCDLPHTLPTAHLPLRTATPLSCACMAFKRVQQSQGHHRLFSQLNAHYFALQLSTFWSGQSNAREMKSVLRILMAVRLISSHHDTLVDISSYVAYTGGGKAFCSIAVVKPTPPPCTMAHGCLECLCFPSNPVSFSKSSLHDHLSRHRRFAQGKYQIIL